MKAAKIVAVETEGNRQEILFLWRPTGQWFLRSEIRGVECRVEPVTRQMAKVLYADMVLAGATTWRTLFEAGKRVTEVANVNPSGQVGIGWAICR